MLFQSGIFLEYSFAKLFNILGYFREFFYFINYINITNLIALKNIIVIPRIENKKI